MAEMNERNAGDNRARMPDASEIPEAQEGFGETPEAGDPVADALKVLAEFAVAQEEKGNVGIKQALAQFMTAITGGMAAGGEEMPQEAMQPMEEGMDEEMPEEGAEQEGEMAPRGNAPVFNPLEAPSEEEDEEEIKKRKKKNRNETIVNA